MALTRENKAKIVELIRSIVSGAHYLVFVGFKNLKVSEITKLRRTLRDKKLSYTVVKKSLLEKVFADSKTSGTFPELTGSVALAYGDDPVAPAREIAIFGKAHEGTLSILGGVFESRYLSAEEMRTIAMIPPRETLLGMLLNVWSAPMRGLVIALDQMAKKQ